MYKQIMSCIEMSVFLENHKRVEYVREYWDVIITNTVYDFMYASRQNKTYENSWRQNKSRTQHLE
jgi:hypothetical protein